ncbi:hypothetical protein KC356_g3665 [Hortaea werneckii]|nr:hypothetical protein KC356_g3665 [Hortaea werneckii]
MAEETGMAGPAPTDHKTHFDPKTAAERTSVATTSDQLNEWTTSKPLRVPPAENLVNTLVLQYSLYKRTGNSTYLDDMLKAVENAATDLKVGPHTKSDGVKAFFAFEDEAYSNGLGKVEIKQIKDGLKKSVPTMADLDSGVIQDARRIMKEKRWSNRLPYGDLGFFLEFGQLRVRPELTEEVKVAEVDWILTVVRMRDRHRK